MILEDSIATCPFRPPRNVGGAYWSSFQYYVLVRPANHEHDLFAGMNQHMQYFIESMLFGTRMVLCIKSSRRMKSGSCAPDMVSRPVVVPLPLNSFQLHKLCTPRNPKMPQQV
jgi:hypothetical protein